MCITVWLTVERIVHTVHTYCLTQHIALGITYVLLYNVPRGSFVCLDAYYETN